jgi:hypothetical protein
MKPARGAVLHAQQQQQRGQVTSLLLLLLPVVTQQMSGQRMTAITLIWRTSLWWRLGLTMGGCVQRQGGV